MANLVLATEADPSPRNAPSAMPGVSALRAFVLTLETSSYSRAAERIGVSHAAVIQQVRALESRLGTTLVERDGRQLKATARGTELFLRVRPHVHALEEIFLPPLAATTGRRLRLHTSPCFATGWLLPRLPALRAQFPGVEFVLDADLSVVDPVTSRMDLALRNGAGKWPGVRSRWLFGESAVPVARPGFASDGESLAPCEVLRLSLVENPLFSWRAYAQEHELPVPARHALVVKDSHVAQIAAEAGIGVALARGSLIDTPLRQRRLVAVSASVPIDSAWWLCVPVAKERDRLTLAVADAIKRMADHGTAGRSGVHAIEARVEA